MNATAEAVDAVGVFYEAIALDTITPSKTNPRKHFDKGGLEELANSIREKGVIQPIVIRPHSGGKPQWELVAGERRWRASKLAGVGSIPAIARNLDDRAVLEIQVIENLQRADVHPLDEANGYKQLLEKYEYNVDVIAEKVGKSKEYVYARLKLADLIPELQAKFFEDKITAGHAILLARLPEAGQITAAKELFEELDLGRANDGKWKRETVLCSVRSLQVWIQQNIHMDLAKAPFPIDDPSLLRQAGACITCPKRTGAEPHLWPELEKKDHCIDRACFNKKLNAFIEQEVREGRAVRITSEWSKREQKGYHHDHDIEKVAKGAKICEDTSKGIYVDGWDRGKIVSVCPNKSCKVHYKASGRGSYTAPRRSAAEQFSNAQASIEANMQAELGRRLYAAASEKIDLAGVDLSKLLKKPALQMILRLAYDRLDSSVRRKVTEELKLKKGQYSASAQNTQVDAYSAKLGIPDILALTIKFGLRNLSMGFTGGWSDRDGKAVKELAEIASLYGVKVDPIKEDIAKQKKEKLAKAKARIASDKKSSKKVQTSTKPHLADDDSDPDSEEMLA